MWKYRGKQRPPFAVEPEAGQESVWDYPRPPVVVNCNRTVKVVHNDIVIASSVETCRVLETASPPTFYIREEDINWSRLVESDERSFCEWKGEARYFTLVLPDERIEQAGWSYSEPFPEFERIRGYLSVYPARVECFVDGARVQPQPGRFYGGWVTPELVGPFKGEPGSEGW
jgi:uncharacterized protein (DUF427 family)